MESIGPGDEHPDGCLAAEGKMNQLLTSIGPGAEHPDGAAARGATVGNRTASIAPGAEPLDGRIRRRLTAIVEKLQLGRVQNTRTGQ